MSSITEEYLEDERAFEDAMDAAYEMGLICSDCGFSSEREYITHCTFCGRAVCMDCCFFVGEEAACEGCFVYPEGGF